MSKLTATEVVDRMLEDFSNAGPAPAGSPDDPWRAKGTLKKMKFKAGDFEGRRENRPVQSKENPRFKWKPPVT